MTAPRELALPLARACAGTYVAGVMPQFTDKSGLVHVYLSIIDGIPTFSWEGTQDWQEWLFVDFDALLWPFDGVPEVGLVHRGFSRDVLTVIDPICAHLESLGWPDYYATGHSKGASEAIDFHIAMKKRGHPPKATWAFEPARCGGDALLAYIANEPIGWTRTRNAGGNDIVTEVPYGPPAWQELPDPLVLAVSDSDDIAAKHRISAVIAALE